MDRSRQRFPRPECSRQANAAACWFARPRDAGRTGSGARCLFDEAGGSRPVGPNLGAAWWALSCGKARSRHARRRRPGRCGRIASVRVERNRENIFTVTATGQELSALVAGARLALDAMRASADAPASAIELLGRVLDDFDQSRQRLAEPPNGDRR
jgi:hypothetical protein